jgi:RHS repeat-associated protein
VNASSFAASTPARHAAGRWRSGVRGTWQTREARSSTNRASRPCCASSSDRAQQHLMHARYYSPTVGRFVSVDPVLGDPARPQTWNRYAYVHNNPINLTDPDGRCEVVCWGLIILGGVLLSGDVANAPAPGDRLYPSPGAAGGIAGSAQSVGFAYTSGAFGNVQTVTRYMGDAEAETARRTGNVPNTDAHGNPRPTHVTTDKPLNDPAAAQKKYELPNTPTQRATVPKDRVPGGLGPTPDGRPTTSGGGSQSATNQPIPVKPSEIKPLNQNWLDRVISWFK